MARRDIAIIRICWRLRGALSYDKRGVDGEPFTPSLRLLSPPLLRFFSRDIGWPLRRRYYFFTRQPSPLMPLRRRLRAALRIIR